MTSLGLVLSGTRILVTAQRRAADQALALSRRGAEVDVAATLGVRDNIDEDTLLAQSRALVERPADVVVITTGIGLRGWLETAEAAGLGEVLVEALDASRLVARGPKARGALQAAGLHPDWVAESETSAEIGEFLEAEGVDGAHVAVQHHGAGDAELVARLEKAGARVTGLVVYRWGAPPDPAAVARSVEETAAGRYDAVTFTSAPGALAWLDAVRAAGAMEAVHGLEDAGRLLLAGVGPVTAEPLRTAGFSPLVPDRGRLGALVRAIVLALGSEDVGVDTASGRLRVRATVATLDHEVVPVSPSGLSVLRLLASDPGAVFSREDLLTVLPGDSTDPHAAEVAIARLREAMGDCPVRTVVKRGYRLDVVDPEELP